MSLEWGLGCILPCTEIKILHWAPRYFHILIGLVVTAGLLKRKKRHKSMNTSKDRLKWQGKLLFSQGWAHYHGPAGDADFHAHYPIQLIFSEISDATVTMQGGRLTGKILKVPSNVLHMLAPSKSTLDLLYIEPTLIGDELDSQKTLKEWLERLQKPKPAIREQRMIRALKAIDTTLEGKVTQDIIALAAGMSKSNFTRLFRETIGMPLRRYVLWRRLNVAVGAIAAGADATGAAHRAGFSDSAHFSRTMKETFGVSATDSLLNIEMIIATGMSEQVCII